jgi:hypothetical protein
LALVAIGFVALIWFAIGATICRSLRERRARAAIALPIAGLTHALSAVLERLRPANA